MILPMTANQVPADVLKSLRSIVDDIDNNAVLPHHRVVSSFLIGSIAEHGWQDAKPPHDLDVLLALSGKVQAGATPLNTDLVETLARSWRVAGKPVGVRFNGVMTWPRNPQLRIDLSWDSAQCIKSMDAHTLVIAKKPYIVLTGSDLLIEGRMRPFGKNERQEYADTITRYVIREYSGRADSVATYAIAKAGILASGTLSAKTIGTTDKVRTAKIIRSEHPELDSPLRLLASALRNPEMVPCNDAMTAFHAVTRTVRDAVHVVE